MRRWMVSWVVVVAPLVALARPSKNEVRPAAMSAQNPAPASHIEVLVLDASTGDGGVATTLAGIPQLRQAPFLSFTQIGVVSRTTLPLAAIASVAPLPNHGAASITLGSRGADGRYTVNVAFTQGAATSNIQFVASVGEPFFTVRSSRADRATIIGFIVRP